MHHLANLAQSAIKKENGEFDTFGSRPPTAPEKKKKGEDEMDMHTPSLQMTDNSMVHIGQITVDRKNNLLGNRFQDPSLNQHEPDTVEFKKSRKMPNMFPSSD